MAFPHSVEEIISEYRESAERLRVEADQEPDIAVAAMKNKWAFTFIEMANDLQFPSK